MSRGEGGRGLLWLVHNGEQVAHLHNAAHAHFQVGGSVFNCEQMLTKISFVIFDIVVKNKSNVI